MSGDAAEHARLCCVSAREKIGVQGAASLVLAEWLALGNIWPKQGRSFTNFTQCAQNTRQARAKVGDAETAEW